MLRENFIKLSRNIMNSDYIDNAVLLRAFIGLMTQIRFQTTLIDGITVDVNEVLLKKEEIPLVFGSSKRQAYETLKRMEKDGILEWFNIRNKYTLIRVIKEDFSRDDEPLTLTDHRHTADKRRTEEEKEKKYEDMNNSSEKNITAQDKKAASAASGQSADKEKSSSPDFVYQKKTDYRAPCHGYSEGKMKLKQAVVLPQKRASAENCRDPYTSSERKNRLSDIFEQHYNSRSSSANTPDTGPEKPSVGPKLRFGEYNNVLLTRDEHNSLIKAFSDARKRIDEFSELLRASPEKRNTSHFDELMKQPDLQLTASAIASDPQDRHLRGE